MPTEPTHTNPLPDSLIQLADTPCDQCGRPLGFAAILGPVCLPCVKENHRRATGSPPRRRGRGRSC